MLFREQRGSLNESMNTVVEVHSMKELREHIQKSVLAAFPPSFLDQGYFQISPVKMRDDRIDWDTYTVIMEGVGVLGFTNAPYFPGGPTKKQLIMGNVNVKEEAKE